MYLLDTNVVSELRKIRVGKADSYAADWADSMDATDIALPAEARITARSNPSNQEAKPPKKNPPKRVCR